MNKSAVETTADTKMLWRYSRQFNKVMLKGEESGNIQYIKHMSFDCDSDTLLITVDASNPFCHMFHDGKYNAGCFTSQSHKFNMDVIYKWISNAASKYVKKMTQYPGLSFSKLSEEMNELWTSKQAGKDCLIHEASDVFVHLLMFLKSMGVEIDDIMNELGKRHYNPRLVETRSYKKCVDPASNKFMIGITCEKYAKCSDNFVLDKLGMRIIRGSGRDLSITYEISDVEKYKSVFGDKIVCFVGIKPKDMSFAVTYEIIHAVIAYNSVLDNLPTVFDNKIETCLDDIKISLIKRVGDDIDMSKWTALNKCKIACEHMAVVSDYFTKLSISPDVYSLHKFLGSSESLLVNETVNRYDLCDAIVSTGKTLEDNNLEEFCTVLNKDEIKIVYAEKVTLNS
jgi:phosphoribosyl-AMP cyclohydrolase / phosphoribosyl-ATP pyrophosphohydrolase